jgi:hypothetical protein
MCYFLIRYLMHACDMKIKLYIVHLQYLILSVLYKTNLLKTDNLIHINIIIDNKRCAGTSAAYYYNIYCHVMASTFIACVPHINNPSLNMSSFYSFYKQL